MATVWFYLLVSLGALIGGALILGGLYVLASFVYGGYLKWKIPKDREKLADSGKQEIDQKEVDESERRNAAKFREFEKLRRLADNPTATGGSGTYKPLPKFGDGQERRVVSFDDTKPSTSNAEGSQGVVRFD